MTDLESSRRTVSPRAVLAVALALTEGNDHAEWLSAVRRVVMTTARLSHDSAPMSAITISAATTVLIADASSPSATPVDFATSAAYMTEVSSRAEFHTNHPTPPATDRSRAESRVPSANTASGKTRAKNSHGGTVITPASDNDQGDTPVDRGARGAGRRRARRLIRPGYARGPRKRGPQRSYGVTEPGAYAATPVWWSREHWRSELLSDLHSDEVHDLRAAVGTRGPISIRAIYAVAVAISAAADGGTGRNALPGNAALTVKARDVDDADAHALAALAAGSGYALTTVQKAVQVLARRGWLVLIRSGKNWLTVDERLELHAAASKARQRRNVWACTLPLHVRAPEPSWPVGAGDNQAPAPSPATASVDNSATAAPPSEPGCDLPTPRRGVWASPAARDKTFKPEQASTTSAPRRASRKGGSQNRTYRTDVRVVRLAKDLRSRVPWLRHVPHHRIMPSLHRFAIAGWTAPQLQAHLDRLLAQRGWSVPGGPAEIVRDRFGRTHRRPARTMRSPWGYLAFLLRHLDPSDLAAEQQHAAELAAREQYQRLLVFGVPCPHGQPAGDVPSPTRAVLACPLCRHEKAAGR